MKIFILLLCKKPELSSTEIYPTKINFLLCKKIEPKKIQILKS